MRSFASGSFPVALCLTGLWLAGVCLTATVVLRTGQGAYVGAAVAVGAVSLVWFSTWARRPRIRDWRDAERASAQWLRKAGCRRVELTGGSTDGGIDVVTADWAVQVKHTAKRVGRPAVQQLVGAALALDRSPVLFSTSGFSAPALAYANDHDVALFELDLDGSAHGVNQPSRAVGRRSRRLRPGH